MVSGAAGATGSAAAQIARIAGCRVIGIAGGPEKCAYLTGELGLDGAVDYRAADVGKALRALCPKGIDVFFDNVGGPVLDVVLGPARPAGPDRPLRRHRPLQRRPARPGARPTTSRWS